MHVKLKKVVFKNLEKDNLIKAIIFDVNGVLLVGKSRSAYEYASKALRINFETWFDTVEPYWTELVKDESKTIDFLTNTTKTFKVKPKALQKILFWAFRKSFRKNRQLFKLAAKLRRHYKTAILSDQTSFSYEAFRKYNLDSLVDIAVWSQKVGLRKPDPKIYKLIIKRLKVPTRNCLFIDNRDFNISPAKKIGMKTILFENNKQLFKQLKQLGVRW